MNNFMTYPTVVNPHPEHLCIECIDPRFVVALKRFREDLGVNEEKDIVKRCAGGPMPLAHPQDMPSRSKGLRKQLQFTCEKFPSIGTIVAIMHEECAYYHTAPDKCHRPGKERSDLPFIGSFLGFYFPSKKIKLYYARFINGKTEVVFDEVPELKKIHPPEPLKVLQAS
ncbi:MAG: hypothetical protein A3F47_02385 [Candidatus Staskawiczbacteria bacterium RIFCSPHIGHO2_12_FULL_38_11]|uniref:Uncharacterized protein n=1 Tax=Candidatus Staskawiczbacteria bacterium RIFCSPHIGHO2_12_FULL_38_11 TaxID=1802209 RepID=A0A1G2I5L1_9BACT|nr:MAG: hypothetical protein A3F47_02385 [Candidatus Staskawiczbacteria bacterium RIFCSPHIGHO2_12_FULL_38_11]